MMIRIPGWAVPGGAERRHSPTGRVFVEKPTRFFQRPAPLGAETAFVAASVVSTRHPRSRWGNRPTLGLTRSRR